MPPKAARRPRSRKRIAREREWIQPGAKARQTKTKARIKAYYEALAEASREPASPWHGKIRIPGGRASRQPSVLVDRESAQGVDDRVLIDNLSFTLPARRHRRHHRPQRRRQDDALQDDRGPGTAHERQDLEIGETVKLGYVDQSRGSMTPDKNVWEDISAATTT